MEIQELTAEYASKTDDELLRLALNHAQLTSEAEIALSSELTRRGLNTPERLESAREDEAQRKAEIDRNPGKEFLFPYLGIGRMRFGKAAKVKDDRTGLERFRTTVFVVLLWLPLVPLGTYLIERDPELPDELHGLKKLPLDWEQVLRVWVVAAGLLLVAIWIIKLLRYFLLR